MLGVDGGGPKTAALIASLDSFGELHTLGQGRGGPSDLRLAGKQRSLQSLDKAVNQVLTQAVKLIAAIAGKLAACVSN